MEKDQQRAILEAMRDSAFYPHSADRVEIRETHISIVVLVDDYVYKIKKPLDLGFLDFTTLEQRLFFCRQEVSLNQRLSHGVYLEVAPITCRDGRYQIAGEGPEVEYAVKMRRLSDEDAMSRLLPNGRLAPSLVMGLARHLARFYDEARQDKAIDDVGAWETVRQNCEENFLQITTHAGGGVDQRSFEIIRAATRAFLYRRKTLFDRRVAAGRIRDCHGDLRAEHVYFEHNRIQVIDCIEFNERFRFGDVAADLAFLAMDLDWMGYPETADAFLKAYVEETGDTDLYTLIDFYKCYRAMVRLKVNSLRLLQLVPEEGKTLERDIQRHLELAYDYAVKYSRPVLWVVCGMPATGKSTIADELARRLDAVVLRSDVVRKQLLGRGALSADAHPFEAGIYSRHASALTYGRLLLLAQEQLEQGRSVILDATFGRRRRRGEVIRLAQDMDVGLIFIECTCPGALLQARLAARKGKQSISDARLHHYNSFKAAFEAMDELPEGHHVRIETDQPVTVNLREIFSTAETIGHM